MWNFIMVRKIFLTILLTASLTMIDAQNNPVSVDSFINQQLRSIDTIIDRCVHNPDSYLIGKLYYPKGTKENHPYFSDFGWKTGKIEHDGLWYPVSLMKYDVERDALIVLKIINNQGYSVELDNRGVNNFTIEGHEFEYLNNAVRAGYYEKLFAGKTELWAKHTVWKKINVNSDLKVPLYVTGVYFVVLKQGCYTEVKSLNNLYNVFADRKTDLQKFKRMNKLSYRKDKSSTMLKIVEQYNSLNK